MVVNTFYTLTRKLECIYFFLLFILMERCKYVCSNKHYVLPYVRFNECHQVSPGPGGVKHLTLVNEVSDGGLAWLRWPGLVTTVMMGGLVTTVMGALAGGMGPPLAHNIGARSEAW